MVTTSTEGGKMDTPSLESLKHLDDMHCHLGFAPNGDAVAAQALEAGICLFDNTVTPAEAWQDSERFSGFSNVVVGFGMHPWWVGKHRDEDGSWDTESVLEALEAQRPSLLGEVGLDFSRHHGGTREEQLAVFATMARWAADRGDRLLSVHAVQGAGAVLDILRESGALENCAIIFHWFSGTSEELKRAIQGGCFFSCSPRMIATGRGREYVKAIPVDRLLLETDEPRAAGEAWSYEDLREGLSDAAEAIVALKGSESLDAIAASSRRLLAMGRV